MKTKTAITIIGCGVGSHSITPALSRLAAESDTLLGGARLLELFPDFTGERITLGADLEGTIKRVAENLDSHGRVIVLASGDSQVFGVAKTIARFVGDDYLTIFPNITAAQALMAELKLPSTENARLFSVHGSQIPALPWRSILSSELSVVYCDSGTPASRVAELLIERFPACSARKGVVGEFLGSEKQRVVSASLRELAALDCAGMSLLLLPPV
ncbi:MAG: precorrin-6y C5,15-methyltransferase (decarboxylating) subunit CbiE, partial [Kiritimatiellaeota bacterium]|nr:precorrin-6y C5,15-methyltransferase (decarboxylating) subunit CbiE [Kiritimatiellota bacterium]